MIYLGGIRGRVFDALASSVKHRREGSSEYYRCCAGKTALNADILGVATEKQTDNDTCDWNFLILSHFVLRLSMATM